MYVKVYFTRDNAPRFETLKFGIAKQGNPSSKLPRMPPDSRQLDEERQQLQRCQRGDVEALALIRNRHNSSLSNILRARGATATETEDLLADLWADCVPGADDRPSLLEKFSGKCSFQGWLATVATRRWIDLKRRQGRRTEIVPRPDSDSGTGFFERIPASAASNHETVLVDLLRESLQAAFAECPPQAMLMLRLVYLHGLTQREVMRMLGWSESKVSRALSQAMQEIETKTLAHLKQADSWLELTWQDFVDLCQTHQIGFL